MRIHLIAVGTRMPSWVRDGFDDYAGRMPPECKLVLREIPLGAARSGGDARKAMQEEGAKMLTALPEDADVTALEVRGKSLDTEALAKVLNGWLQGGRDQAPLTLPHGLVRVIVAEQLYRAWSILKNHPYHRA